jgi:hypothetical protein
MSQRGGLHPVFPGRLQNLAGAGRRRAIGDHLQVLVTEGRRQVFCPAAGDNQLPTQGSKSSHQGPPDTACGAGDDCGSGHVVSSVAFISSRTKFNSLNILGLMSELLWLISIFV